jgi:hypothetical protein
MSLQIGQPGSLIATLPNIGCGQQVVVAAASPLIAYEQQQIIAASPAPIAVEQQVIAATPAAVQYISAASPVVEQIVEAAAPVAAAVEQVAVVEQAALPLPALPPVNSGCYAPPPVAAGITTSRQVQLPTELRQVNTVDADVQTVVRENNNYTQLNKDVITTVNRNHQHIQRIQTNENNFNTYVTNNITKVNDIHSQRVEAVQGQTRVINNARQTQTVEPARCLRADGTPCANNVRLY